MKTTTATTKVEPKIIDATGVTLGRVATGAAMHLRQVKSYMRLFLIFESD